MSGYNYTQNSDDDFVQDNSGGGLRKMLEQVLEENKKLREAVEGKERAKTVTELLKGKGLDPAIAELVPEGVDPAKWLDEKAHLFGIKQEVELLENAPVSQPEVRSAVQDDPAILAEQEALAAMQDAEGSGYPASASPQLLDEMNKINDEASLIKFFNEHGASGTF